MLKKIRTEGISLRYLYRGMVVITLLLSSLLIISTFRIGRTFGALSGAMDEYIELQKAAHDLTDASDYLTEQVQRFTVTGNREFLDRYFVEAFQSRRRDEALSVMAEDPDSKKALQHLQAAMDSSLELMDLEYYAMRLVIDAQGIEEYPEVLADVKLSEGDAALSKENKMALARTLAHGSEYYDMKNAIRSEMKAAMTELDKLAHGIEAGSFTSMKQSLLSARILILLLMVGIVFIIFLTLHLGVNPVLQAVERIKSDHPLPVIGAIEFRYLAKTYNKMYDFYRQTVNNLNFKASHDELTKVYNRAGYDLLVGGLDLHSTCMLLIDIDNFKTVNDTYGHEMGDRVLKRAADVISHHFRSEDYVCRIGGDEFAVFMVHMGKECNRELLTRKVNSINEELRLTDSSLPPISISAGAAAGSESRDAEELFVHADEALYETKRNGRNGISFYRDAVTV